MIVGVETGGTKVVCAISTPDRPDRPLSVETFPTSGPGETLARIRAYVAGATGPEGPEAIGFASFGPVDVDVDSARYGRVLATPKTGWENTDVVGPLVEAFGAPVALMTDVSGALLAERLWGAALHRKDAVYLTVGTGIGAGILAGGRVIAGTGYPEIAHLSVRQHPDDDFAGICPFHGNCVEGMASGPAIRARWGADLPDLGDDGIGQAVEFESFYLGQLVSALYYTLGTPLFVVGGGVANWPGLRTEIGNAALRSIGSEPTSTGMRPVSIVAPELGGLAGVTGALAAAAELLG